MAYKSFLVEKYEYTHENIFFREINETLKSKYENVEGIHVLIGNISVSGHCLDAIFIKSGAIIVIDFKDYEGKLTFSENGPWKLTNKDGKMIFVAGGAKSRNPFQQVNAYRFGLFQLLSEQENKILDTNHNINWGHTNCIILFQRKIEFNSLEVPGKITRFFHITDLESYFDKIEDIYSNKLNLTDSEIEKILSVLSIDEKQKYDESKNTTESKAQVTYTTNQIDRIKKLIPNELNSDSEEKKSLLFYKTMIELEKLKTASVSKVYKYPLKWSEVDSENYHINIKNNREFFSEFEHNKMTNFPKNLFISIDVSFDNYPSVPLFYTTIITSEIKNNENIQLNFNSFSLFTPILEELQLSEDITQELVIELEEVDNINQKIELIKEKLNVAIKLNDSISIGLSNEQLYSVQLISEFNQWLNNRIEIPEKDSVFRAFITNAKLPLNKFDNISFIQISELNKSQENAVKLAFRQPVSIITGPPGTGKSQVVMNIIANAVFNSQKVLFASKNNKAVDNVYDRINSTLDSEYFLRFGNNDINLTAKEKINCYKTLINNKILKDKKENLSSVSNSLSLLLQEKKDLVEKLNSITFLREQIDELKREQNELKVNFNDWLSQINTKDKELYIDRKLNYNSIIESPINLNLKKLEKTGFFENLLFNLFDKRKICQFVEEINQSLPQELILLVDTNAPYYELNTNIKTSLSSNLKFILSEKKKQEKLITENLNFEKRCKILKAKIEKETSKLNEYLSNQENYRQRITEIEKEYIEQSKLALNLKINQNLIGANSSVLDSYSNYLTSGLPWRNEEKMEFSNISKKFIEIFNSISISNLTIKKAFLQEPEIFDLLIIDEASQCDVASVLPLIYRCKRLVVLGDPLQLQHITSVNKFEQEYALDKLELSKKDFNYIKQSFFDKSEKVSNENQLEQAFLKEHYRCHPDIIKFSNDNFYLPKAGQELVINTNKNHLKYSEIGFNWIDVNGKVEDSKNINLQEIQVCCDLVDNLREKYPKASIGITTPFKDQKNKLIESIKVENVTIDTVHGFQGDEKDIMIFSLVVTNNSKASLANFINFYSSYLLNVAITRAKSGLFIVGNHNYCENLLDNNRQKTLLAKLTEHKNTLN